MIQRNMVGEENKIYFLNNILINIRNGIISTRPTSISITKIIFNTGDNVRLVIPTLSPAIVNAEVTSNNAYDKS